MNPKQRVAWERGRDLDAELRAAIADARKGRYARKTEFKPLSGGRLSVSELLHEKRALSPEMAARIARLLNTHGGELAAHANGRRSMGRATRAGTLQDHYPD